MRRVFASLDGWNRLRSAKNRLGLSFGAIANQAGVSASTMSRLFHPEQGKGLNGRSLDAIAQVLDLTSDEIWQTGLEIAKDSDNSDDAAFTEAKRRIQKVLETDATGREVSVPRSGFNIQKAGRSITDSKVIALVSVPRSGFNIQKAQRLYLPLAKIQCFSPAIGIQHSEGPQGWQRA